MAIYTIQIKPISRSSGHSAIAKIAYNCRDKITDLRTGEIHRYNSKKMSADLLHSEITHKDLTLDKKDRAEIWNNAELAENRKNSRTAREYVIALPKELSKEQNIALVRAFAKELTTKYNNVADWAIHNEKDGNGNIHAHILTTTRQFDPKTRQLGDKTDLELDNGRLKKEGKKVTQEQIELIRKDWETIQNEHLALAGLNLEVSCKKKINRNTVKKHLGKEAVALERQGVKTDLGTYNRTIDDVVQLEWQVDVKGFTLEYEIGALERLELQKQAIERQRQDEINRQKEQEIQLNLQRQQQELDRQQELIRLRLLKQKQAKIAEDKRLAELKAKEQEEIARLEVPADNFITASSRYSLFDIAREHKEFFTKQTVGDYEYWTSRHGDIDVHKTHININKQSDESIKLALDVAVTQFGDNLDINGSDDFIQATIDIIANDERYADITLDNPEHQEMLDSKRLDIEIENAVDLDLTDAPDLELDEPEVERYVDRGWSMSR